LFDEGAVGSIDGLGFLTGGLPSEAHSYEAVTVHQSPTRSAAINGHGLTS